MSGSYGKVGAILVGAGSSQRMGGVDKMLAPLADKPVIAKVVDTFQDCANVDLIVIVTRERTFEFAETLKSERKWGKVKDIVLGGERRQDSVANGLACLGTCDWVIVHDCARPLVTMDMIERGLEAAQETGSAVAAVPVTDTIKEAGNDHMITRTVPRENLWESQTPQIFRFDIISEAYRRAKGDATDDAALVEQIGHKVKLYMGSYDNIKITNPHDLVLAELLWQERGK
jgi:2-C-methyl-D-erythritol 4-phosphate cytidylyltransferase